VLCINAMEYNAKDSRLLNCSSLERIFFMLLIPSVNTNKSARSRKKIAVRRCFLLGSFLRLQQGNIGQNSVTRGSKANPPSSYEFGTRISSSSSFRMIKARMQWRALIYTTSLCHHTCKAHTINPEEEEEEPTSRKGRSMLCRSFSWLENQRSRVIRATVRDRALTTKSLKLSTL